MTDENHHTEDSREDDSRQPVCEAELKDSSHKGLPEESPDKGEPEDDPETGKENTLPTYDIVIPEELRDQLEIDTKHPLVSPIKTWAQRHGLSQEAFSELTSLWCHHHLKEKEQDVDEQEKLDAVFGAQRESITRDLGQWFYGLLEKDFEEHEELLEAAEDLCSTAQGVLLIKSLYDRLKERSIPEARSVQAEPLTESLIYKLQSSEAYNHPDHPDHQATVNRVRAAWTKLYPTP